ncbi:MAG: MFS transporter, partial [Methylococcaceae bacterium]|nr:MFS transporter [Methylococcaceae bacterium]
LFIARSLIGLGEAGYGAAGVVLIASHFPARLRSTLVASLFATSALGSVAGILLGGVFSAQWGWHTTFGLVGIPGLLLGILFLWVKDYPNANPASGTDQSSLVASSSIWHGMLSFIKTPTVIWVCIGAAAQLVVVSAVWSWLPSYLNRYYQLSTPAAGQLTAAIVLGGAFGCVLWGRIVDKTALHHPNKKLTVMALLCGLSLLLIASAFSYFDFWNDVGLPSRLTLIAIGAFAMTCTIGPASAIIIDVTQDAHRVTGASVLTLFQNLFGLATGPFLIGLLADQVGLDRALSFISLFSLISIFAFLRAKRFYKHDIQTIQSFH